LNKNKQKKLIGIIKEAPKEDFYLRLCRIRTVYQPGLV